MAEEPEELKIVVSDQVKEAMAGDADVAAALREFFAAMHQANHAVQTGQYASMDDALEAILGSRPRPVD